MSAALDPRPVVCHSVIPYLPKSGSWIHSQIARLARYRAIVVTKRIENRETFPFEAVYSTSELGPLAQAAQPRRPQAQRLLPLLEGRDRARRRALDPLALR
jgi:hypothetical protein